VAPGTAACDTMTHLLMGNYRIYLAGGWGWWWRVELAGGTHPSALRAPWSLDREECMWAGPTLGGKISSTWSCVPGSTWSCITGALILPHC